MLDSRYLSAWPKLQGVGNQVYTSRVIIRRKALAPGHIANDGPAGENVFVWNTVYRGWIAAIVPASHNALPTVPAGTTEIGDFTLTCPYRRMASDGKLIIRERDILYDMISRERYLVLWAHDPLNSKIQIVAGLLYGVTEDPNSGEQS